MVFAPRDRTSTTRGIGPHQGLPSVRLRRSGGPLFPTLDHVTQSILGRESAEAPASHAVDRDRKTPAPLGQCRPLASELDDDVRSHVRVLLLTRCPSAVRRLVVPIRVAAVDRVLRRRTAAHVREERFVGPTELRVPRGADRDPSRTVVREELVPRLVAAPVHRDPREVLGRRLPSSSLPMRDLRSVLCATKVAREASARLHRPARELRGSRRAALAAEAHAVPETLLAGRSQSDQSAEALASDVPDTQHTKAVYTRAPSAGER